jgi:hypothetical protein
VWKTVLADDVTELSDRVRPMIDAVARLAKAPRIPGWRVADVVTVPDDTSLLHAEAMRFAQQIVDAPRMAMRQVFDATHDVEDRGATLGTMSSALTKGMPDAAQVLPAANDQLPAAQQVSDTVHEATDDVPPVRSTPRTALKARVSSVPARAQSAATHATAA